MARLHGLLSKPRERLSRLAGALGLRRGTTGPAVPDEDDHDLAAGLSFAAEDAHRLADGDARIAFVGCLPPEKTGVATSMHAQLLGFDRHFDLFVPVAAPDVFLRQQELFGPNRVFSLESLLPAIAAKRYDHVVFVIGNSRHFAAHVRLLPEAVEAAGAEAVVCYLHDPYCTWVAQLALGLSTPDLEAMVSTLYGRPVPQQVRPGSSPLFDAAMYGPRLYFERFGVRRFLANSQAAAELIRGDLGVERAAAASVETLFLHVEDAVAGPARRPGDTLIVGSFGVPSAMKLSNTVVEAVRLLNDRGRPARLLMAGYHAQEWVRAELGTPPDWLDVAEPETEADLRQIMRQCDVAVQLRAYSQGETSGVVTCLMGLGIPTIVSPLGAFLEFGDAVVSFAGTPGDLADLLHGPQPPHLGSAMRDYARDHSLAALQLRLAGILAPRGTQPGFRPADAMPTGRPG